MEMQKNSTGNKTDPQRKGFVDIWIGISLIRKAICWRWLMVQWIVSIHGNIIDGLKMFNDINCEWKCKEFNGKPNGSSKKSICIYLDRNLTH